MSSAPIHPGPVNAKDIAWSASFWLAHTKTVFFHHRPDSRVSTWFCACPSQSSLKLTSLRRHLHRQRRHARRTDAGPHHQAHRGRRQLRPRPHHRAFHHQQRQRRGQPLLQLGRGHGPHASTGRRRAIQSRTDPPLYRTGHHPPPHLRHLSHPRLQPHLRHGSARPPLGDRHLRPQATAQPAPRRQHRHRTGRQGAGVRRHPNTAKLLAGITITTSSTPSTPPTCSTPRPLRRTITLSSASSALRSTAPRARTDRRQQPRWRSHQNHRHADVQPERSRSTPSFAPTANQPS